MEMFWFIPTTGDGRYLGSSHGSRLTDYTYLRQIAQAVDELGYGAVLLPTGNSCEDAWVVASTLMPSTRRLKFLVAVRPGVMSPTLAARMTATFDRLSQGRVLINVVTGGDPLEAAADGVFLSHDERYEVTGEFLTIWRSILAGETRARVLSGNATPSSAAVSRRIFGCSDADCRRSRGCLPHLG